MEELCPAKMAIARKRLQPVRSSSAPFKTGGLGPAGPPAADEAGRRIQAAQPIVHPLPGLLGRNSIALLEFTRQRIAMARNGFQVIARKFSPLFFCGDLPLLPLFLDLIPFHNRHIQFGKLVLSGPIGHNSLGKPRTSFRAASERR
jgi:hypothetical protein